MIRLVGNFIFGSVLFWGCSGLLRADDERAVQVDGTYTGAVFGNVHGGYRNQSTYMGVAEIGITTDTEKLGLWKNGRFFVGSLFSHGPGITRFVGDYQDPVYIAYEVPAQVSEYWYEHRFFNERLAVKIGKQDSCSTFFYLDSKADFFNSSFTCPPGTCMPTLPHNTHGVTCSLDLLNDAVFKVAVHDAGHGVHEFWESEFEDAHFDMQIEKRYSLFESLPGFVYCGGWYDTSSIELNDRAFKGNYGFSIGIDQTVWRKKPCRYHRTPLQEVTAFTQIGTYKKDRSELRWYYDLGLTCRGFLRSRPEDHVGIACTTVCLSPGFRAAEGLPYRFESAYECFYKFQVTDNAMLQPNLQYIVHPGGQYKDALLIGLAFQVAF